MINIALLSYMLVDSIITGCLSMSSMGRERFRCGYQAHLCLELYSASSRQRQSPPRGMKTVLLAELSSKVYFQNLTVNFLSKYWKGKMLCQLSVQDDNPPLPSSSTILCGNRRPRTSLPWIHSVPWPTSIRLWRFITHQSKKANLR